MDTGRCASDKCAVRNSDELTGNPLCCGQVATEVIEAECEGWVFRTRKITACGCIECPDGDEIIIDGEVYVEDGDEVTERLELKIEGLQGSTSLTVHGAKFRIEDIPSQEVVTFKYTSKTSEQYLGTVVVLHVVPGVQSYNVEVQLTTKPEPVIVDPGQGATIYVGQSPVTSPAVQISIPPHAIVDVDGNAVQGDVNVFVSFSDPRVENGLSGSPGEFSFQDDEGGTMQLQTFGVVGLHAETSDGQKAYVSGQVDFDIDVNSLGIPDPKDGEPGTSLWALDSVSGNWEESGGLTGTNSTKRRKRQTGNNVPASSEFPPNIPYINIDKPLLRGRQCYVSVFVYTNENMTVGVPGKRVRIYTKDMSDNRYLGQSVGTTDHDGKVCLPLACGLKHELAMHHRFGPETPEIHHLPGQFDYQNHPDRARVEFISPLIQNIVDNSGPFHRYERSTCQDSTKQDYHFQFYLTKPLPQPGTLYANELKPNLPLSWYDRYPDPGWVSACAIGINVVVSHSQNLRPVDKLLSSTL